MNHSQQRASGNDQTIRSLMEQNDELLARLRATQNKCAEFEQRYNESEFSQKEIQNKFETLCDQVLVLKEKDSLQKNRLENSLNENKILVEEQELQNLRLNELQKKREDDKSTYELSSIKLSKRLGRSLRFRSWITNTLYPAFRSQKRQIQELKSTLKDLHAHLYNSDTETKSYKDRISTLEQNLKEQSDIYLKNQGEVREIQQKCQKLRDERTVHQNRVVAAERALSELQRQSQEQLDKTLAETSKYRQQSKALTLENNDLCEKEQLLKNELEQLKTQNQRLRDQNESIQELWTSNRKKTDQLGEKEEAMQKLNQELSLQLKSARQELSSLKQDHSDKKQHSEQRLRQMQSELELLKEQSLKDKTTKKNNNETVVKLEALLAEVQSGYSKPSLQTRLPEHSFIEKEKPSLMSEEGELQI